MLLTAPSEYGDGCIKHYLHLADVAGVPHHLRNPIHCLLNVRLRHILVHNGTHIPKRTRVRVINGNACTTRRASMSNRQFHWMRPTSFALPPGRCPCAPIPVSSTYPDPCAFPNPWALAFLWAAHSPISSKGQSSLGGSTSHLRSFVLGSLRRVDFGAVCVPSSGGHQRKTKGVQACPKGCSTLARRSQ